MRITLCAGHGRKRQNKDDTERETRKGTFEKKSWKGSACNTDIRSQGLRQQLQGRNAVKDLGSGRPQYLRKRDLKMLQLESTGNLDTTFRKTMRLGIAKRIADLLLHHKGSRNGRCGGADPLRNGRSCSIRVRRARCGGAPATPGVMAPTGEKVTL
jgi:hypothetical protein